LVLGFTKLPVSMLVTASLISNAVLALIVSPFFGLTNLAPGILFWATIMPIGVGLQDPSFTCWPLVNVPWPMQKLIKLFVEVRDGTCPASVVPDWPF